MRVKLAKVMRWRYRRLRQELRHALVNRREVPITRQLVAWRHGFYAESSLLYDFATFGHDAYVSDRVRVKKLASVNRLPYVLGDKLAFSLYLKSAGCPTPTVYGLVEGDRVLLLGAGADGRDLSDLLAVQARLVVKPRHGTGGEGFGLLERSGGKTTLNGVELADVDDGLRGRRAIISEFIQQHDYARSIYPGSTNTLRLVTLTEGATAEPIVVFAVHRFGTEASRPVDNVRAGGLSAHIDLDSGTMGPAAAAPGHSTSEVVTRMTWHDRHPDTGERIAGTTVPGWALVKAEVQRVAAALPDNTFVGWDVVVTPDGISVLEGNVRPDVNLQMHRPLLLDPRVRSFFEERGVLRRGKTSRRATHRRRMKLRGASTVRAG